MPGTGTLFLHPSNITGAGPSYSLVWNAGEMLGGAPLNVTVSGLQDLAGNPVNPAAAGAMATGMGTAPVISGLAIFPETAATGDTVQISFTVSEALNGEPSVTVDGHTTLFAGMNKAGNYDYTYEVSSADPTGAAEVSVSGFDMAGNLGALSDQTSLTIVRNDPGMPLRAWPVALVLATAALAVIGRRNRRAVPFLLALLAAASTAMAAGPVVSNVAVTQGSDSAGGTRVVITYDLVSPGGSCGITVRLSKDGGADGFVHPVTSIAGDIAGVPAGAGHRITWNIAADYPNEAIPQARIRVTADDAVPGIYTFTYLAGPNGSISGATPQTVPQGADGTGVVAVANTGYHFVNWSDGSTQNPRTDKNAAADITVTANFEFSTYMLVYTAGPNGSISGITPQYVSHGGNGTPVTAVANPGYRFIKWNDNSTQNPRTDTNVTSNRSVAASFMRTHTLAYSAGANGSISGSASQIVDDGGSGTAVTAAATAGFHFVNWSDGSVQNPRTDTNVTADIAVTANFAVSVYTLTYSAGGHGSISGTSPQTVPQGGNGTAVTAVPNIYYHFVNWSDGSTQNPRTDSSVAGNITVTASFAVTFNIGKVADVAGNSWVSSLWGYNAPKIAYDGSAYYAVALDGVYGAATGAVYKYQGGVWTKGYTWTLNYQPPMIMVDDAGRLVIVYANSSGSPTILRSTTAGNINAFAAVNSSTIPWAGYMGAGIYGHKLVLGYISDPNTYSFWIAAVDLNTGVWTTPKMLAQFVPGALPAEVTWLYPIITPRADGIHMSIANNADANNLYNEVKYMKLDYSFNYLVSPESVDIVPPPYASNYAFHDSMLVGSDGAVYIASRNLTGGVSHTYLHRRDGVSGAWTHNSMDSLGFTAAMTFLFESPSDPGRIWLTRQSSDRLYLYNSSNGGATWNTDSPASFTSQGLAINFVHGIEQGSSGTLPTRPTVVFTASPTQPYSLWFLQWLTN